ncbi:MAG: HAD family hydrolase, partial [Bacteroidota bacterium]
MIQMVVFDMAGTTVNEHNLVYRTLQQSITEAGFPVSLEQVLTLGAGKEKLQAVRDILGEGESESRAVEIHQHFVQRLAHAYEQADVSAFADCEAVFASLRERQIK